MTIRSTLRARPAALCGVAALSLALFGTASAETLADAAALAYESNPALLAQRAQLRAANETYVQARSGFGVRASLEASESYETLNRAGQEFHADSNAESLAISTPVFTGGRATTAVQAAENDVKAARERLRQAEADLLQRVVAAYTAVRRDQQMLAVYRSTVTVLQQQLEETRAKSEVRENTRTDLAQAEARLAAAQAQAFSAEAALANSRANYLAVVGRNPGELAPEPDLPTLPENIDKAMDQAETANNTLLAAKFAELASRARINQARAQYLPSVNVRLQASRNPQANYLPNPYYNSVTAQATVSQPLYTSGQTGSAVRRAVETNTSDRLQIDATRRNVIQVLSQQWNLLSAARNSLVVDQANITASETAFFGMRQEERFGLRSTIELLNAQNELTSAQISLLRDRYSEYTAKAAVLNALGRLTIDALAPNLKPYDPTPDFDRVKNKGALPTELVVRALDSVATPSLGDPAKPRETATPDRQLELPPAPPPAAEAPPIKPVTTIMDETRNIGRE